MNDGRGELKQEAKAERWALYLIKLRYFGM